MVFVRSFCDNFLSTLLHINIMFLLSLFLFLPLLFFTNKKREKKKSCHNNYLKLLFKYHCSCKYTVQHIDEG